MNNIIKNYNITVTTGRLDSAQRPGIQTSSHPAENFQHILEGKLKVNGNLTFSKHAQVRSEARNISLTQSDMHRLEKAVGMAENKGLNDTLILMDSNTFIVNVPNRVVVTVMDSTDSKDNVFTNIDGAVIV